MTPDSADTLNESEARALRQRFLFTRLVLTFQAAAMQQMGKVADPLHGKIVRDLEEAGFSIDTLDMLQQRCAGNLAAEEERFLKQVVADLKLNYIDEIGRPAATADPTEAPATMAEGAASS